MASRVAPKPTFFLSDLSTQRNGHIVLGNIFSDPFQVDDKAIGPTSKAITGDIPEDAIQSVSESNLYLRETRASSWSAELWAKFLSMLSISIGADHQKDLQVVYEVSNLETVTLSGVVPYIRQRIARETALQKELVMGYSPSLYMITGIKYSKGLKVWADTGSTTSANAGAGGTVSPEASMSAGAGMRGSSTASRSIARSIEGEVVLAYQLAKITPKKIKTMDGTFLSDGGTATELQLDIEGEFGTRDVIAAGKENDWDIVSDFCINAVVPEGLNNDGVNYSRVFSSQD